MAKYKKKVPDGSKGGRPLKDIDAEKVEIMAASFLAVEQIARILDCDYTVIYDRFSNALQKGRASRRYELSCAMWHKALVEKDTKMMIWLSKQHLGYRDTAPEETAAVTFNVFTTDVPVKQIIDITPKEESKE